MAQPGVRYADLADADLVAGIERGDPDALAEVYARWAGRVHGIVRRLCGNVRAQDLVQEIFVDLWRRPGRYDPHRGSLGAFLSLQAHTRSIDLLRSGRARGFRDVAHGTGASPAGPVDEAALRLLDRDELDDALTKIPAVEREAIVLAFFGGHTCTEVARLIGSPEGTVKSRIRAGLSRLRLVLQNGTASTPHPSRAGRRPAG